jgi:hypothetical protein
LFESQNFLALNWTSNPIKYIFFLTQHKILHEIKPKNIKFGQYLKKKKMREQTLNNGNWIFFYIENGNSDETYKMYRLVV